MYVLYSVHSKFKQKLEIHAGKSHTTARPQASKVIFLIRLFVETVPFLVGKKDILFREVIFLNFFFNLTDCVELPRDRNSN